MTDGLNGIKRLNCLNDLNGSILFYVLGESKSDEEVAVDGVAPAPVR
jgi:hypothetical protein